MRPGQRSCPTGDRSPRPDEVRRGRDQRQRADQPQEHLVLAPPGGRRYRGRDQKQPAPAQPPSSPAPRGRRPAAPRVGCAQAQSAPGLPRPAPGGNKRKGQQQHEQPSPDDQTDTVATVRSERGTHRLRAPVDEPPCCQPSTTTGREWVSPSGGLQPPGWRSHASRGPPPPAPVRSAARPRWASTPPRPARRAPPRKASAQGHRLRDREGRRPGRVIVFSPPPEPRRVSRPARREQGASRSSSGLARTDVPSRRLNDQGQPRATPPGTHITGERDRGEPEGPATGL